MDCVESCGYNNLSLSRVVARVFFLKSTPVMCSTHASLRGKDSRELPVKSSFLCSCLESSRILSPSHTTLTNKSHMKYMVHNIEHNSNQIWHKIKANKNLVVNYNFTISFFGYSVTKPLKQTLDLNMSLGTVVKLTHT